MFKNHTEILSFKLLNEIKLLKDKLGALDADSVVNALAELEELDDEDNIDQNNAIMDPVKDEKDEDHANENKFETGTLKENISS